jgi:hypothetical protein
MRRKYVIGPDGRRLTVADLPSRDTKRWVIQRKAEVVAAVRGGLLSVEEACKRYALNFEEFRSWERCIDSFGKKGLRTTWTQVYRYSSGSESFIHEPEVEAAKSLRIMIAKLRIPKRSDPSLRHRKKTRSRGEHRGGC